VELSRSTLADWVGRCGVELTPLVGYKAGFATGITEIGC